MSVTPITDSRRQEVVDRFYAGHGPCCAGCDWWHHITNTVGECRKSAPVRGDQRYAMIGVHVLSTQPSPGHILTPREHHCGDFKDEFDWSTLAPSYLRRIGRGTK